MKTYLLALTLFAALTPQEIFAQCSCPTLDVAAAYERASVVFIGRVQRLTKSALRKNQMEARFSVLRRFKGFEELAGDFVVAYSKTRAEECGYQLLNGQDYIVYATGNPAALLIDRCSRTGVLDNLLDDVEPLERLAKGLPAATPEPPKAAQPAPTPVRDFITEPLMPSAHRKR